MKVMRLDHTSGYEQLLRSSCFLSALLGAYGMFRAAGEWSRAPVIPYPALGMGLLGLLAALQTYFLYWATDDTFYVNLDEGTVNYQRKRLLSCRREVLARCQDVRAVGVDYVFRYTNRDPNSYYALVLILEGGAFLPVSDWLQDGYSEIAERARAVAQATGWTLLDSGPEKSLKVVQQADGRVYARQADQGWQPVLYIGLQILAALACGVYMMWPK